MNTKKLKPTALCMAVIAVTATSAVAQVKTFAEKAADRLFALAAGNGMVLGANALTKQLEVHFEEFIIGFDAACVISQEAQFYYPDQQAMQRAGDTVYRAQNFHMAVTSGLDISAATPTDVIQRMVPATYKSPQNVLFQFDAKEMRDPNNMQQTGKAAGLRLAAQIDSDIYSVVAQQAANVLTVTGGGVLTWDMGALAEAVLLSKGMPVGSRRKMFLNPFDYKDVAKDLGNRAYLKDETLDAYERSRVPAIAGFETFRTDNLSNLAGIGTVSGTTVSGAQSFTPSAMTGNLPTDNRQMPLVVAGANIANIKNGDCFTIGTGGTAVNAVHNITKDDSGQLQTFRVLSGGGTANLVITPAIVATGPYKNVSQAAGAGAAINFINTVTKPVNAFWVDGAVELMAGKLAFPEGQGAQIMTATSKNGIPLIMSYAFDHLKGKTTCRYTSLYATTVLQPELCGIILAKQT